MDYEQYSEDKLAFEKYWQDWAARSEAMEDIKGVGHRMTVNGRSTKAAFGIIGCCLLRLYYRLRDDPAPLTEGEVIPCSPKCADFCTRIVLIKGMWRWVRDPKPPPKPKLVTVEGYGVDEWRAERG